MGLKENQERYYSKPGRKRAHSLQCDLTRLIRGVSSPPRLPAWTGCSNGELIRHLRDQLEEGMTWEDYGRGRGKWAVDHIRPKYTFDLSDDNQLRECFDYRNLRPRWNVDNSRFKRTKSITTAAQETTNALRQEGKLPQLKYDKEKMAAAGITIKHVKNRACLGWPEERWYIPLTR